MKIGYARVSTIEQDNLSQRHALENHPCDKIVEETISGTKKHRPVLQQTLDYLRENDTLVVYKLDRLGRSALDIINIANNLQARGINLISIKENYDTSTPQGKFFFQLTASLAELERNLIAERTKDGLRAARARGRVGGRPRRLNNKEQHQLLALHQQNIMSVSDICKRYNISRSTFYAYINREKHPQVIKHTKSSANQPQ